MSAQSVMLGLYPLGSDPKTPSKIPALPYSYQPIPIHTSPIGRDDILIPSNETSRINSLIFNFMVYYYVTSSKKWKQKEIEYSDRLNKWSRLDLLHNLFFFKSQAQNYRFPQEG